MTTDTQDEQIEKFLRHHTFPCSNRKAAKAELLRIIERAVQAALDQDAQLFREAALDPWPRPPIDFGSGG